MCAERAWVVWFGRVWVVVCCARRIVIRPATAALSRCRRDAPWPVVSQVLLHPPPCALDCLGPCATGRGTWLPWPLHRAAACRPLRTCASKHRLTLSCRDNIIRRSCARPCGGGWTHNPPHEWCFGVCMCADLLLLCRPSFRGALDHLVWANDTHCGGAGCACILSFVRYSVQRWLSGQCILASRLGGLHTCVSRKHKDNLLPARHGVPWFWLAVTAAGSDCRNHVTMFDHLFSKEEESGKDEERNRKHAVYLLYLCPRTDLPGITSAQPPASEHVKHHEQ